MSGKPVFVSVQLPEQQQQCTERQQEKENATVVVQVSVQEGGIDASSEHGDGEDSHAILGDRERNSGQDDSSFAPERPEKQMCQHHAGDNHHEAGSQTAASGRL